MNNKMKAKKTNTFEWKCDGFIRSMIVNDFYKIRSVGRKFNPVVYLLIQVDESTNNICMHLKTVYREFTKFIFPASLRESPIIMFCALFIF